MLIGSLGTNFLEILIKFQISYIFIKEYAVENALGKLVAILSWPQRVNIHITLRVSCVQLVQYKHIGHITGSMRTYLSLSKQCGAELITVKSLL